MFFLPSGGDDDDDIEIDFLDVVDAWYYQTPTRLKDYITPINELSEGLAYAIAYATDMIEDEEEKLRFASMFLDKLSRNVYDELEM